VARGSDRAEGRARKVKLLIAPSTGMTYVANVIQGVEFGRQPTMNAEKLLVHDGSKGECAERVHAGLVQAFGVLTLTCMRRKIKEVYEGCEHADSHSSLNVK
jgi:hypothetical protein